MSLRWDSPDTPVRAGVILLHGFARSPQNLAGVAGLLATHGCLTVRPAIPSFTARRSLHDPGWLDVFGNRVGALMRERAPGVRLIGIGHSAGAAVIAGWSTFLDGVVLVDPVDRHHRIERLGADMQRPPLRVSTADPSACNRHGRAVDMLAALGCVELGRTWVPIAGASHADPERVPVSLQPADVPAADLVARLACGRGGSPTVVCRWGRVILEVVAELIEDESI